MTAQGDSIRVMRHDVDTFTVRAGLKSVNISFVDCNISASAPRQNALIITLTSGPFAFWGFLNRKITDENFGTEVNGWTVDALLGDGMPWKEQQQEAKDGQIPADHAPDFA